MEGMLVVAAVSASVDIFDQYLLNVVASFCSNVLYDFHAELCMILGTCCFRSLCRVRVVVFCLHSSRGLQYLPS